MRVAMLGTGPFAVPTFRALLGSRHAVVVLVTQPVRPAKGRRRKTPPQPMREIAGEQDVPILDPENINAPEARAALARFQPELLVVADYGQILRPETIAVASHGAINLHGSLLPRYRGAAPVQWAIYHGEKQTGVTVFQLVPQVDAGPILAQQAVEIEPDETANELEQRLARLGAQLVIETIDAIEAGKAEPKPQHNQKASRAPRLTKQHGLIDWHRSAEAIRNHIRAMTPWPGTYTFWHRGSGEPLRLAIGRATPVDEKELAQNETGIAAGPGDMSRLPERAEPGTVLIARGDRLVVATGDGALRIESVQPAGKRWLTAAEFLRGYPIEPGQRFGPPDEK